jgi:hypothetical protein
MGQEAAIRRFGAEIERIFAKLQIRKAVHWLKPRTFREMCRIRGAGSQSKKISQNVHFCV